MQEIQCKIRVCLRKVWNPERPWEIRMCWIQTLQMYEVPPTCGYCSTQINAQPKVLQNWRKFLAQEEKAELFTPETEILWPTSLKWFYDSFTVANLTNKQ